MKHLICQDAIAWVIVSETHGTYSGTQSCNFLNAAAHSVKIYRGMANVHQHKISLKEKYFNSPLLSAHKLISQIPEHTRALPRAA